MPKLTTIITRLTSRRNFLGRLSIRAVALAGAVFAFRAQGGADCDGMAIDPTTGCCLCFPTEQECIADCNSGYGFWCWAGYYPYGCCECVEEGYDPSNLCESVIFSCVYVE
jgi:hypothetical protein